MTTILVTGATGTVGSALIGELVAREADVRAFVRDADKAAAVLGAEIEVCVGDFADSESLTRAMRGVDRVFLACANHPRQVEYEANALDAAKAKEVERVVKLSALGAEIGSPLDFWDAQGRIEVPLAQSRVAAVLLRPTTYMTGVLAAAATIADLGMLFVPAGQARVAMIDPRDVAAVAAVALTTEGHEGSTWTLTGPEALTYGDVASRLSTLLGRRVEYVDVPDEQARAGLLQAGMPDWLASNLVTLFALIRQGVMTETTDTVFAVTGRPPRTFDEFAQDALPAFATRHR